MLKIGGGGEVLIIKGLQLQLTKVSYTDSEAFIYLHTSICLSIYPSIYVCTDGFIIDYYHCF